MMFRSHRRHRGLCEVAGYRRSLEYRPFTARRFYGVYAACVIGEALFVGMWPDPVLLNVGVQVINALLLPVVLDFLIALARRAIGSSSPKAVPNPR